MSCATFVVAGRADAGPGPTASPGWVYGEGVHDEPIDPFNGDPADPTAGWTIRATTRRRIR
ncbi:hypothetical protein GCM10027614_58940 [Micromonospora vulcania]